MTPRGSNLRPDQDPRVEGLRVQFQRRGFEDRPVPQDIFAGYAANHGGRFRGGLLVAQYGKGTYIYTGYVFFRQLPAGVPGAIRLYVNLLSAGHGN